MIADREYLLALLLVAACPLVNAQTSFPTTQEFAGYVFHTDTTKIFPTADLACRTLDYNQPPGTPVAYTYQYVGTWHYSTRYGRETLGCYFMLIATPGSGLADKGPQSMAGVEAVFATVCDKGSTPQGACLYPTPKNEGDVCTATNHPINLATGNKFSSDTSYRGVGPFPLTLSLHYNSTKPSPIVPRLPNGITPIPNSIPSWRNSNYALACHPEEPTDQELADADFLAKCAPPSNAIRSVAATTAPGSGWRHSGQRGVAVLPDNVRAGVSRPDGKAFMFTLKNGMWSPDADVTSKLVRLVSSAGMTRGWQYTTDANEVETYDILGRLVSITDRNGLKHTYAYNSSGAISTITDSFGRSIALAYDEQYRLHKMTDPAGQVYTYAYDAKNNLASVTYPDNLVRTYLYENASFPNALTGVIDENGKRMVSYFYDTQGRSNLEYLAGEVDRTALSYGADGKTTTITDGLNTVRTITFASILGVNKVVARTQPGGAGCNASSSNITYDANGNVTKTVGFNGEVTTYGYDVARNLETLRTEAFGTAQARTISRQWHSTMPLPMSIAEPKRLTTFTYDSAGNELTKTVQATNDATGTQGFNAAVVGTARKWTTTYNSIGQVTSITGPRTDVVDVTTFAYDAATGNLTSVTNAAGHVTTLSDYDAHGRAGRITDANGVSTDMTYTARGWLAATSTSSQGVVRHTTYDYDGVGQLKKVTMPDGSSVEYSYDDAHRLTRIADSAGNTILYTLDSLGNRVKEDTRDPHGTLKRQTTRVYDALSRLQQITGGVQ